MSSFDELYAKQLALEAVTVGFLFVPWTYVVSGLINRLGTNSLVKMPLGIFVAGAGFHLVCEATGLNEYYLTNSAAHMRHMRKWRASCKSKPKNREKPCGIYFMELP